MKKVLILYFSGVGATKKVAEIMYTYISQKCTTDIFSIENNLEFNMNDYDAFIIGTPVYHAAPSRRIMRFINEMEPLNNQTYAFIYNTRALWSCNTNRIFSKKLKKRNVITIMDRAYQSPASDGTLIIPFIKRFFKFEKRLRKKILFDCTTFLSEIHNDNLEGYLPHFRLSSILNAPNKLAGLLTTVPIYLHQNKCTKFGICVKNCPLNARGTDMSSFPTIISKRCENCYRCIHHCPAKALSLSKRRTPTKVIKYQSEL